MIVTKMKMEFQFLQISFIDSALETIFMLVKTPFKHTQSIGISQTPSAAQLQQQQQHQKLSQSMNQLQNQNSNSFQKSPILNEDFKELIEDSTQSKGSDSQFFEQIQQQKFTVSEFQETQPNSAQNQQNISKPRSEQIGLNDYQIQEQMKLRRERALKEVLPLSKYKYSLSKTINDLTARELFAIYFSDLPYKRNGKTFLGGLDCFLQDVIREQKVTNTQWTPEPPQIYLNPDSKDFEQFINFPICSTKKRSFLHIQDTKIPFLGKIQSDCYISDKLYYIDDKEFVMITTGVTKNIPYSDNFELQGAYFIKEIIGSNNKPGLQITQALNVKWVKSTWFVKSTLESQFAKSNDFIFNQKFFPMILETVENYSCLLYTSPSPRDQA
eukprot:TRINITY_DN13468_c0_g1_i4.p1 TRINITY_DN13468_c0_g1~~TRINITY_DN13468_c0_g1_i4.p1  ORF type:complete len:384 (+),score=59.11 TRINITY_DN13468_c0_g1_i4:455-1606(+)